MEVWKKIEEFEYYEVSNLGRVKSNQPNKKEKILKNRVSKFGYIRVMLQNRNVKKESLVHRLVCLAFLPNTGNKPQVNHINGIKSDNRLENLEWCSVLENMFHSLNNGRNKKSVSVIRYLGNKATIYHTIKSASIDNEVSTASIHQCLKGKSKTCNGYKWKYLKDD